VAGLDTVAIPVHTEMALINTATLALFTVFALGTLAFFGLIQAIFQRLVVHNLKRAAGKLTRQLGGQADTEILAKLGRSDQIEQIIVGIEELAGHLRQARSELEEHAATLEAKVARRTEALKSEATQRQADVALFVDMLHLLNGSQQLQDELAGVLERLAGHFGADVAAIACIAGPGRVRLWPEGADPAAVPAVWRDVVVEARPLFKAGVAAVPMSSTDSGRGALCLVWSDGRSLREQPRRLLCALGQQLGIALDNQDALLVHLRQKDLLQSVFDGIADPLALLDRAGAVVLSNESSRSGADMARLLETGPGKRAVLERVLQDGGPVTFETALDERVFTVSLYPLPAASRGSDRVVAYARDITAEKRIVEGIRQHEKMATVGRLAAGLAHEINNPLGVIQCYADLLLLSARGEREREDVEVIIRHSRQASKILSDILSFARPKQDAGTCSPGGALSHMARVFSVQASAKRVAVEVEQPAALPSIAIADSSLEQVLGNLMLNALDAVSPGTGRIRVSAGLDPALGELLFEVADNGPGVPEGDKARIFDPFYTTKEPGRGTGLGLTVVYGLVSEAGGSISVENRGGAVFRVRLPVTDKSSVEAAHDTV
jgi:signal transduction histidine kinase